MNNDSQIRDKKIPKPEHLELFLVLCLLKKSAAEMFEREGITCTPDDLTAIFNPTAVRNILIRDVFRKRKAGGVRPRSIIDDLFHRMNLSYDRLWDIVHNKE